MNNAQKDIINWLDYLLVFMMIATSGIMFFYKNDEYIIIGFLISAILFVYRKHQFTTTIAIILILFLSLELLQMLWYRNFSVKTSIGTAARLLFAFFVIKVVNKKFVSSYVNILYFLALVSFFFYLLIFIPPVTTYIINSITPLFKPLFPIAEGRYQYMPNVIIYNYNLEHVQWLRNSGPFWESGVFSIYLNIALMLNTIAMGTLFNRKNIVFILAILTTFSTTGYIALFFFVLMYYLFDRKVKYKLIYLIIFGTVAVYAYYNVAFLSSKVEDNIARSERSTGTRFGSALADLKLFAKQPILGYGRSILNRFGTTDMADFMHRNNGVTGLLTQYGLIIFIVYFLFYYLSFVRLTRIYGATMNFAAVFLTMILIMGFTQRVFAFPFFLGLMFLQDLDSGE